MRRQCSGFEMRISCDAGCESAARTARATLFWGHRTKNRTGWLSMRKEQPVINNGVHYVADEQPEAVAQLIERYASL
jgi:hypothetical protein